MKKKILALLCTTAMIITGMTGLAGCAEPNAGTNPPSTGNENTTVTDEPAGEETEVSEDTSSDVPATDLSGSVSMAGSTSMENLVNALAESFMIKYPGVAVTAEFTGSSAGVESVLAGSVDIGNSSRSLNDGEKESGAVENIVAIDGIALVVDTANTVTDLTRDQLISI
ncbi:MAG: substrate-binding domain-containing protein, partial [Lachnospiraceae bacterium]|nr:substrate-binding domain-containing protein [Lachnospiraceae bacterium]